MWGDGSRRPGNRPFDHQFEPDGEQFLYRRNLIGQGVPVSRKERVAFIRAHDSAMTWLLLGLIPLGSALFAVGTALGELCGFTEAGSVPFALGLPGALFWWRTRVVWNRPGKALAGRPKVGLERSASDARMLRSALAGWNNIGLCVLGVAVLTLVPIQDGAVPQPADWLWLAPSAIVISGVLIAWSRYKRQAMRAHRRGMTPSDDS